MAEIKKLVKRREVKKKGVFKIDKIYKTLKDEIKARGFDYTEKERTLKQTSRGDNYKYIMAADRKFDDFVKFNFRIEIIAEKIKHGKVDDILMDMGDIKFIFSCWLEMDYLNKWNRNSFTEFLFKIYLDYIIKGKIEDVYEEKCMEDFTHFHDLVKELIS